MCSDDRRLLAWLDDDAVTGHQRGGSHSAENRERKIPWGNHGCDTTRDIMLKICFAGHVKIRAGNSAHLSGIVPAEVDRLGNIGVALDPVLAGLKHFPGGQNETGGFKSI